MSAFVIASSRPEYSWIGQSLKSALGIDVHSISEPKELTVGFLDKLNPKYVFFPHWSYIIPSEIHSRFNCVVFHMTDLPYGRGGSPLQNLIVRGHTETKISALKCERELDAGPIYLKMPLSLHGSARQILERCSGIIFEMICEMIKNDPVAVPQTGSVTMFQRRKPEQSNISDISEIQKIYDYIRMLDAVGYPSAFLETSDLRFEFTSAELHEDEVVASVRIRKKN